MTKNRPIQILVSFTVSLLLTAAVYFIDKTIRTQDQIQSSLQLARQVSNQVEALTLYAREKQELKPLNWAIQYLSAGSEDRLFNIHVLNTDGIPKELSEKYDISPHGNFRYAKILSLTTGDGIKIQIRQGYLGFLGSKSSWLNDLLVFSLFCLFYLIFMRRGKSDLIVKEFKETDFEDSHSERAVLLNIKNLNDTTDASSGLDSETSLRQDILSWQSEGKDLLMQLGLNVRNLIREAKNMAVASGNSRSALESLFARLINLSELTQELESMALGTPDPSQLETISKQLQSYLDQLKEETNLALSRYNEVSQATTLMNEHITKSTETLIQKAKKMQQLKNILELKTPLESSEIKIHHAPSLASIK